jgi:uncharacterized protein (TIGR02646 family)
MKHINKGKEPASLLSYRKQPQATYEDYREKDELRESLLKEQGYICCYCMERITKDNMKIEHWRPQTPYPQLQLDYQNLLAACNGNEGKPPELQHCDTKKGDKEIIISPTDSHKNCEQYLKYSSNGRIYSENLDIDKDLNETLNLNLPTLVKNRNQAFKAVIQQLTSIRGKDAAWSVQEVKRKIQVYENGIDGKYESYCQMIVYFLKKRFRKELGLS